MNRRKRRSGHDIAGWVFVRVQSDRNWEWRCAGCDQWYLDGDGMQPPPRCFTPRKRGCPNATGAQSG